MEKKTLKDAAVSGGETRRVELASGGKETVTVKLLTIAELPRFFELLEDETALAEFVTGKPEGWASGLTFDSLMDLVEAATNLNFPNALRWAERRAGLMEQLAPIAQKTTSSISASKPD